MNQQLIQSLYNGLREETSSGKVIRYLWFDISIAAVSFGSSGPQSFGKDLEDRDLRTELAAEFLRIF